MTLDNKQVHPHFPFRALFPYPSPAGGAPPAPPAGYILATWYPPQINHT
jgi:hypothetical protein